jgi:Calcineurin-like phosphoesterase
LRIALIGDIGGHATQLGAELSRLGARPDGRLPPDLVVVQVGDLVHRGPDSAEVVDIVDFHLRTQPRQWIQLVGNHEAIYVRPPAFHWSDNLSRKHRRIVKRWWNDGDAVVAATVETADESFLVTHAGITAEFWSDVLGGPATATEAARRINELARTGTDAVFRAGVFLHGTTVSCVGPLWADAATELLPGWADRRMPFSQIHGHSSIVDWREQNMTRHGEIHDLVIADFAAKHETVHLAGGRLIGIDPGHRDKPTTPWRALELTGVAAIV